MNRSFIIAITLLLEINAFAQQFDKDTILYNGNSGKHINLVILSDGYTSNELSKFVIDASNFTTAFFKEIPFSNYKKYFNVFIIKVPSVESGASHPGTATDVSEPAHPVITVNNYFGSTFDYSNIHRLLVATRTTVISNVLAANFPDYDQVLILVNSPYYGGSGGYFTVASSHSSSSEIAIHELGHSFSGLRDEYWAGDMYATEGINMTKISDPAQVRWKNWIGTDLIGLYKHCCGGNSSLWYKPHQNCKMQYLGTKFCAVCAQATVEKIHSLVNTVESFYPQDLNVTTSAYPLKFKVRLISPMPNTLKKVWILNDSFLQQNTDSVFVKEISLHHSKNTLKVTIEDTTQLLRVDNHSSIHISSVIWSISNTSSGIESITSSSSEIVIDLYPNPATDIINIKLIGETRGKVKLELFDTQGKKQKVRSLYYNEINSVNLTDLNKGIYIAKIFIENNLITSRKIIKN